MAKCSCEETEMKVKVITALVIELGHASDELAYVLANILGVEDQLKDRKESVVMK
jgi:hypothetical protein